MKKLPLIFTILFTYALHGQTANELTKTPSGLEYKITKEGSGKFAKPGDRIWLQYIGWLQNDSIFASSEQTGTIDIYLGQGQVTEGWEEGLKLVREGGNILLKIPPKLGYGSKKVNGIPANSTLYFEIAVLQINNSEPIQPFNIQNRQIVRLDNGLKFIKVTNGKGNNAKNGDNAFIHYTGYVNDTIIFDSSIKRTNGVRVTVGAGQINKGLDMALLLMNEGSKMRIIIPPHLAYANEGKGTRVKPGATITMDIELLKLEPEVAINQWDITGKESVTTASGLKYYVLQEGEGEYIKPKDIVHINYTGYLKNGTIFDSSVKRNEPFHIPAGIGVLIDGWEEALLLMRKGSKYQLHIPAKLGYGKDGSPPSIPANANLILDVEILDVF